MGTINFKTGDVMTLGLNLDDFEMQDAIEVLGYTTMGEALRDYDYDELEYILQEEREAYMKDTYELVEKKLNELKISDRWFEVKLEYGYYESFELLVNKKFFTDKEIEYNRKTLSTPSFIWDAEELTKEDKEEIKQELEVIRVFLKSLLTHLNVCYPSWTGGWVDVREVEEKYIDEDINEVIEQL